MAPPGILYVTTHPHPNLPPSQFHDWYNNEHGPLRLRVPNITNGFRYRAIDLQSQPQPQQQQNQGSCPEWLAIYDVTDVDELMINPSYLSLRTDAVRTQREKDVMARVDVDRGIFELRHERRGDGFVSLENRSDQDAKGSVLVAISVTVEDGGKLAEFEDWYHREHGPVVASTVPGWRRTRFCATAYVESGPVVSLVLHEFAGVDCVNGAEYQAALNTDRFKRVLAYVGGKYSHRTFQWHYTFGPAPRELASLVNAASSESDSNTAIPWSSNDGLTRTFPSQPATTRPPAIESFVTTPDGVMLPYRLEGSSDPNAPLIALSNCILVDWSIWDGFVDNFLSSNPDYRILRYLTRGRQSQCGRQPINIDLLASDIINLLDTLRVPRAAMLVGVSLGGITVLNTSLLYPSRVSAFVACDTNSSAPESNRKAWGDRIALAEKEGAVTTTANSSAGDDSSTNKFIEPIVGSQLAEATARRWLVPDTYTANPSLPAKIQNMIALNSLDGFRHSAQALCAYDVRGRMASASVPGLFVAGGNDGVLPQTMKQMASDLAGCAELKIVEKAGHLPMVEQPEVFTGVVNEFLGVVGKISDCC